MTSTNDGKEVKSNQTSSQKGKSYFIEIYKSLDSRLCGDCSGLERTQSVCEAWRRIYSLCSHSAPSTHPHLLSWLQRHTASTVLQTEWTNCQDQHTLLREAIDEFIQDCTASIAKRNGVSKQWELQLRTRAEWFKKILPNPWGHPVLKALLDSDQTPSDQEILEWLKEERGVMFVTRLRQMAALKSCVDLALRLAAAVMKRARLAESPPPDLEQIDSLKEPAVPPKDGTFAAILRKEAGFTPDVWEFLTDLEFVLLHKSTQRSCIDLAKQVPFRDACPLVERLQSRPDISPKDKKLWKSAKEVALLIAQVVIARCMVVPACRGAVLVALYGCSRSLARLMAEEQLGAASVALAAPAASAHHLHTMAAAVHKQLKGERTQLVCQLYVRAITAGMNELERLKLNKEKSAEARATEQTLSTWFKHLGTLLSKSNRLRYECVLTAFSVHPSPAMYEEVKGASEFEPIKDVQEPNTETTTEFGSWATDSRTQTNFVKTSTTLNIKKTQKHSNVLSTAIFSEGEALDLEPELCNDLAVLLSGPRVKTLTWDMDREALLENCRTYMKRTDFGTRALTTELKYLNLDPSSFQHLPEEDDNEDDVYYGIEKGYEHLVELQEPITDTMPPEIWQEAFYESPVSSDESVTVVRRRKKKKKIPVVATTAEDPLKLDIDTDINTNPEGSNIVSKKETDEVGKECNQDIIQCNNGTKAGNKSKKEKKKERKKEKKEAKQRKKTAKIDTGQEIKKEANRGAFNKLLGMKVARKNNELRNLIKNTERMMFPMRPQENKDKKVANTQETSNVIFDGLFSMDEMSLTDSQNKGKNLNTKQDKECITQSVTKHNPPLLTPISREVYNQIKTKIVNEIKDDVKSSIKKLIDFRRHKGEQINNTKPTPKEDSTNPKIVPSATPKTVTTHKLIPPKPDLLQKKHLNHEHALKGSKYLPSGGCSNTKLQNQIQSNDASGSTIKNIKESCSQKAYEEFLMSSSFEAENSLNTRTPIQQPVQASCQKQFQDLSKVYNSNPSLLRNELKHSIKPFPGPLGQSLYTQEDSVHKSLNTGTAQNKVIKSCELSNKPSISATSPNPTPVMYDPTQKHFQEFLKELQESVNPGTMVTQKPEVKHVDVSVGTKKLKAPKIAENAPNTFSRLSYLHKSKQLENKLKTEEERKAREAANHVPKDLNRMLPIHLQNRGEIKISRIRKKSGGTDQTPLRNHKKSAKEPTTSRLAQNHRNLVQALQQKTDIDKDSITNIVSRELKNKINNQIIAKTESYIKTKLSEKDQTDLLQLLRQQNKLNAINTPAIGQLRVDPSYLPISLSKTHTTKDAITVPTKTIAANATHIQNQQKSLTKIVNPPKKIESSDTKDRLQLGHNQENKSVSKRSELNTNSENTCNKGATPKYIQFKVLKDSEQELFEIKDMNLAQSCNFLEPKCKEIDQIKSEKKDSSTVIVDHCKKYENTVLYKQSTSQAPRSSNLCDEKKPEQFLINKKILEDKLEPRQNINPAQPKSKNASVLKKQSVPKKPLISRKLKETSEKTSWESVLNDLLKHKTPSRGPNALDVALNKDTFKQHVLQTTQNSDSQSLPTNNKSYKYNETNPEKKITVDLKNQSTGIEGKVSKSMEKTTDAKRFIELQPKEEDPFISGIPNSDYDLLDELMDDDLRQEIRELSDDEAYCPIDLYTPKEKDNITGPGTFIEKLIPKSTSNLNVGINGQNEIMTCSYPKSVITKNPQKSSNTIISGNKTSIISTETAVNTAKMSKKISTKKDKAKPNNKSKMLKTHAHKKQVKIDEIDTSIDKGKSEDSVAATSLVTKSSNIAKLPHNINTASFLCSGMLKVPENTDMPETSSTVSLSNNSKKVFHNMKLTRATSLSMSKDTTIVSQNVNSVPTCSSVSLKNKSEDVSQNTILTAAPSSMSLLNNTKIPYNTNFVTPGNVIIRATPKTKGAQNILLVGSDIACGLLKPINMDTSTADTNSYSSKNISFVKQTSLANLVKPVVISNVSLNLTPESKNCTPASIKTSETNVQDLINNSVIVSCAQLNTLTEPELIESKRTQNFGIDTVFPNQSTLNKINVQKCSVFSNKFANENISQHNEKKVLSVVQEKLTFIPGAKPILNISLIDNDITSKKNAERLNNKRFSILNRETNHYGSREAIPLTYTSLKQIEKEHVSPIKDNLNTTTQTVETCNALKIENSTQTKHIKSGPERSEGVGEVKSIFKPSKSDIGSSPTSVVASRNTLISPIKSDIPLDNTTSTGIKNKYKILERENTLPFDCETGIETKSSDEIKSSQNIERKIYMQSVEEISTEVAIKTNKDVSSNDVSDSSVLKTNENSFQQQPKCNDYTAGTVNVFHSENTINSKVKLDDSNSDICLLDMYRDRIHFEELPKKPTDDQMKRIVRIKLPNGTTFKATISGKLDINIDSIFSDPQMKAILLNNVSKTKKCTLNIKQMTIPDDTDSREKTIVNKILYPNNVYHESETINLVSDDECEEIDKHIFKTEFGEFSVSFKDIDAFTKHQKRLSDKCTVQLEKSEIIDRINAAKACLQLKAYVSSDVLLNNENYRNNNPSNVIEIDDSSDDSVMESHNTHAPRKERVLKPKLSTDIDLLRNSIIKGVKLSNINEDSNYTKSEFITEISSINDKCIKKISEDPIINKGVVDLSNEQKQLRMKMKSCHVKLIRCDDDSKISLYSPSKDEKSTMDGIENQIFKNGLRSSNSESINEFNYQKVETDVPLSEKLGYRSKNGKKSPNNIVPYMSGEIPSMGKQNIQYEGQISSEQLDNSDKICENNLIILPNNIVRAVTSFSEELCDKIDSEEGKGLSLGVQELPTVVNEVINDILELNQTNDNRYDCEKSLKTFNEYDVQKAASFEGEESPNINVNVLEDEVDKSKLTENEEEKNRPNTDCEILKADENVSTHANEILVDSGIIDQVRSEVKCKERNNLTAKLHLTHLIPMKYNTKQDSLAGDQEISSINNKVLSEELPTEVDIWKKGNDEHIHEISTNKPKKYENQSDATLRIEDISLNSARDQENEDTRHSPSRHITDKMKDTREGIPSLNKKLTVANSDQCELKQNITEKLIISKENESDPSSGDLLVNEIGESITAELPSVENLSKDEFEKYKVPCIISLNEGKSQIEESVMSALARELFIKETDQCEKGNYETSISENLSKNQDFPVLNEKILINQGRKDMASSASSLNDMEQEYDENKLKEYDEVNKISTQSCDITLSEDGCGQEKSVNIPSLNEKPLLNEIKDPKERNDILAVNKELYFEKLSEEYECGSQKENAFYMNNELPINKEFRILKESRNQESLFKHIDSEENEDVCSANKVSLESEFSSPILERRGSFSILINYSTYFDTGPNPIDQMSTKIICECFADWYLTKPLIHRNCNMNVENNSLQSESFQIRNENAYLHNNVSRYPDIIVTSMANTGSNVCKSDWYYTKHLIHVDSINSNLIFQKQNYAEDAINSITSQGDEIVNNTVQLKKNDVLSLSTIMAKYFAQNTIINFLKPLITKEYCFAQRQSRKRKIIISDSSLIHRKVSKQCSVLRKIKHKSECEKNIVINCESAESVKQEHNLSVTDTNKKEKNDQINLETDNHNKMSNLEIIPQSDKGHQSWAASDTVKPTMILDKIFIQDFIHKEKEYSETILDVGILKADIKDKFNSIDSHNIGVDITKFKSYCNKNDQNDHDDSIIATGKKNITDAIQESQKIYNSYENEENCIERSVIADSNVYSTPKQEIEENNIKTQQLYEDANNIITTNSKIVERYKQEEIPHNVQRNIYYRDIVSVKTNKDCVLETLSKPDSKDYVMNKIMLHPKKTEIKNDMTETQDIILNNMKEICNHIKKDIIIDGESQITLPNAKEIQNINSSELVEIKTDDCLKEYKETVQPRTYGIRDNLDKFVNVDNMSGPELKSHTTHKYSHSKNEDGAINNVDPTGKDANVRNPMVNEGLKDENRLSISKKMQKNINVMVSDKTDVNVANDAIDCVGRSNKISNDHKDHAVVDNITLLYKGDSDLILKGSIFKDPVVGTCYLFPIRSFVGKDCKALPKKDILISKDVKFCDSGDSYNVMIPKITYSKQKLKLTENRLYTHAKRSLKRKSDTSDSKYSSQKRYRNGKNIDYPKISVSAIKDFAYVKEFKTLYDYWDSIKFSFSRPFHKENFDVNKLLKSWPIQGEVHVMKDKLVHENILFLSHDDENRTKYDPLQQTLADELSSGEQESIYQSIEINETNFSMGFGEGSDRVIQQYGDQKISAATLSDVKLAQPFSIFKYYKDETVNNNDNIYDNEDEIEVTNRFITYVRLKNKVRSFFKRTTIELNHDWIYNNMKERDKNSKHHYSEGEYPFDIDHLDFFRVPTLDTIVQVVQVGQLPVSAAAQNPVSCDPRVTQVTDASPPQCSAENSPRDGSQPSMKTEYTELTTADLSLPLVQEYERQHNETMNLLSQENHKMSFSDENIPIETEVNSIVKIEIAEEVLDNEEQNDNEEHDFRNIIGNHANDRDYCFNTNETNTPTASKNLSFQNLNDTDSFMHNEENQEKTDQIAHAMNAAGITTNTEPLPSNETHDIGYITCDKSNEDASALQTPSSNYSKTNSINAIALQQALAQILPPPLNRTNVSESNHQTPNNPQVLHIVQGKNSSVNQLTLVENTHQSVINATNSTPVLHIVQNKGQSHSTSTSTSQSVNSFNGLSLVENNNMAQGGSQLLHIVNTNNQKTNNSGQLLKRVNLLTNLSNVQGNEQKMVQFVCKSADGKSIQLNAPHQRSMVLRIQPIESSVQNNNTKTSDSHNDLNINGNTSVNNSNENTNNQQEIKSRSVYEENYAKFIQSAGKPAIIENSTSLPKFNQAFGKQVFQDENQKTDDISENHSHLNAGNTTNDNTECQTEDSINMDQMGPINNQTLLLRKSTAPPTSQSQSPQPNLVQHLKQTITPMNLQTMHGGVIYTRQIPVNIGGGQTINLITVPSTELLDDSNQKQHVNQSDIESSIIKIVPQNQASNSELSKEDNRNQATTDCTPNTQPQPVLTQMRIKLPMLSKPSQIVSGTRVVRPSFFQIQRNVIGGANQQVYQQLVLTAAPSLGQQTIRLPQSQASRLIKVPSENQTSPESQMSSSTLEQLREFDMVLEQVKERSTVQPNPSSNNNAYNNNSKVYTSSTDTTDISSHSTVSTESTHQVLYRIGNNSLIVNRKTSLTTPTLSTYVRSPDSSNINDSPSSSTQNHIPHSVTSEVHANDLSSSQNQHKPSKITSKSKSKPKPSPHQSSSVKINTVPPKPSSQKPFEDEQTTQRILYILAEYKEQVENSPDKDKPAPRRRTNPPSNPGSSKRKKSSSSSRRSGTRDMSPLHGEDTCRTMGSEDSSCGTSQGDCNESCMDSHSPQDSPQKVVRKLTFEPETPAAQPRPQPQRNVIVADGQTITVSRNNTTKPTTAVLMPANYILPVSMVKSGQQIAIVTNRGPKILTVGGGEGGGNAVLLQRLIGPGLKPVLTRPGVRHVRLPAAALHNLQAFTLGSTASQQPDSTASSVNSNPPELIDTRATASPWADREVQDTKPDKQSSPESTEPWNIASSNEPHDYSYEEIVRSDNLDRTVLDAIPDRYSPDMEAQRIFDKMFDIDSKRSYIVDSQDDSPRCGYDIDASDCDDKPYHQVVHRKDGTTQRHHRLTHVSSAALRHRYAMLEHELRLQKSLSEECEDLGVDSPSASELFPEAELLFSSSPAHDATHHSHTPQPIITQSTIPQPDMDDQIATDQLISQNDVPDEEDLNMALGLDNIVTVSGDGTITLDPQEFARSHPNTTFHKEPTDESELQPFTIANVKGRHMTSTIFHASRAPATVLVTAPPHATVISQAAPDAASHSRHAPPSVVVKDGGPSKLDTMLDRELHLSNTASTIIHAGATQVIRRVCYDDDKTDPRFLESHALIGHDAKMTEDPRGGALESMADVDDDRSSPERNTEMFWESNSTSERSEGRRPLDFSSDSDKCCKSPFEETNSTDSSGIGTHIMRLDSVIKDTRGMERSGSADGSSADDTHPPLRTYPPKRYLPPDVEERSTSGKTRAGERSPDLMESRRRASNRGVVKRGCHCCNGSPAPPKTKKSRPRKPNAEFAT